MSIIVFFVGGDFDSALGVFIPSGATADIVVVVDSDIARRGVSRCSRKITKKIIRKSQ